MLFDVKPEVKWVVVSRYVTPKGQVIQHVWGPVCDTRSKALVRMKRLQTSSEELYGKNDPRFSSLEYRVTRFHEEAE